ncbi:MAG: cupredoxin domain-containing protein [Kofleriaceae bacterium]|nr:cupredoxin domain-containing protein [Kofleriaceae bacterium]
MKTRSLVTFLVLVAACGKDSSSTNAKPASSPSQAPAVPSASRVEITVTEKGFEPEDVAVPAGKSVTLVFTRKTDQTCAKEVILAMADGTKIEKPLPLGEPVEIATTFSTSGKLAYACAMDMIKGTVTVQ